MAVTQKKDGRWAVYYRVDGRVRWEYFGRGPDAEAAAYRRNAELGLGRRMRKRQPTGPLFADLAGSYSLNHTMNANSRKHLLIRLEANVLPHFGPMRAAAIKDIDVDRYVAKRRGQGVKDSTINRELTDVKAILNWATKRRPPLLVKNPIRDYSKPATDDETVLPPTRAEMIRILKCAKPHLLRALLLAYYTGLRPGAVEMLSLTWDAVDFEADKIMITGAAKGRIKQTRPRLVPIHPELKPLLVSWWNEDGQPDDGHIVHYRKRPIKKLQTTWEQCRRDAKIKRRLRFYDLRHAHITLALEAGADIGALSRNVGSRPETLRRHYQHVTEQLQRDTIERVPALPAILKKGSIAKKSAI